MNILPIPRNIEIKPESLLRLRSDFSVEAGSCHFEVGPFLHFATDQLRRACGWISDVPGGSSAPGLKFYETPLHGKSKESYVVALLPDGIRVESDGLPGWNRGLASLVQWIEQSRKGSPGDAFVEIPSVRIVDAPAVEWRGMHLDCARHFQPVSTIRALIDAMWRYRFNRLHLHLTDDQGWRLEVKSLPALTEIGSQRKQTLIGHVLHEPWPKEYDGVPHGGFYSQAELRALVGYAAIRGIEIIPEIEMPGHATAAVAACPELGCSPGAVDVACEWGIFRHLFNAGSDRVIDSLGAILAETMDVFSSPWIHLGGDECPTSYWERSPECQRRLREEGLENFRQLHAWFLRRMGQFVLGEGRIPMVWDDALEGGLPLDGFGIMVWRGPEHLREALSRGHDVINCDARVVYFDHYQTDNPSAEPLAFGGCNTVEAVRAFRPIPKNLPAGGRILGAQGHLWTEYIGTQERLEYALLPRMLALSESLWGSDDTGFSHRLANEIARLRTQGVVC